MKSTLSRGKFNIIEVPTIFEPAYARILAYEIPFCDVAGPGTLLSGAILHYLCFAKPPEGDNGGRSNGMNNARSTKLAKNRAYQWVEEQQQALDAGKITEAAWFDIHNRFFTGHYKENNSGYI